ncbi:MAG: hypothetical protein JWR67_3561 [Mucilaginibacter sp.]|nr:hypothetical protein [Mucilaginibacter sp.]
MEQYDNRIDAYIAKSADFAKPILEHIRKVVHEASPLITENIKWGMPFFEYKGTVCQMAAFKQHCAFGFWKASRLNDPDHLLNPGEEASAGSFGRINSIADLPDSNILKGFVLQGIQLNESGVKNDKPKPQAEKKELIVPEYFIYVLNENPKAKEVFDKFSYSNKKDYVEWIIDAKSETTRQKRIETAIEWLTEGKSRMWKYQ